MTTIAVDAMGGDLAPKPEVEGAIRAATSLNVKVILVGMEDVLRKELSLHANADHLPIRIHHASEVVTMEDSAAKAMRTKKDSSIRIASRLQREGLAQGVVSAGETPPGRAPPHKGPGQIKGGGDPPPPPAIPPPQRTPALARRRGGPPDISP